MRQWCEAPEGLSLPLCRYRLSVSFLPSNARRNVAFRTTKCNIARASQAFPKKSLTFRGPPLIGSRSGTARPSPCAALAAHRSRSVACRLSVSFLPSNARRNVAFRTTQCNIARASQATLWLNSADKTYRRAGSRLTNRRKSHHLNSSLQSLRACRHSLSCAINRAARHSSLH